MLMSRTLFGPGRIAVRAKRFSSPSSILILTAARTGEVIGARKAEFDLERAIWTVPAARMKAGREHRVPLSPRCVEILQRAFALGSDNDFAFASSRPRLPLGSTIFQSVL